MNVGIQLGLTCRIVLALGFGTLLVGNLQAETNSGTARLIRSPEPGWPQFRGPRRDGICEEKGLLKTWPLGGPKLIWSTNGIGYGFSAPIITGNHMYLAGETNRELHIYCLDLHGAITWQTPNGRAWDGPYPGARASCTYSDGHIFHMNAHGRLVCLDASSGKPVWTKNILEDFDGKVPTWGMGENLLVHGNVVIVTPGGARALMVALDKRSGTNIWNSEPLRLGGEPGPAHKRLAGSIGEVDNCGYGSPLLFQLGQRPMIVNCSERHIFAVDADTGQLLWSQPFPTRYKVVAATPVLVGDDVFVTAPDTEEGGKLLHVTANDAGTFSVHTVWTTTLDTCHGGVIYRGDALYGSLYRRGKGWASVNTSTGAIRYGLKETEMGAILWAEDRLYCLNQDGEMMLLKPAPDRFDVAGRFRLMPTKMKEAWAHPVIAEHKLYLRYQDNLFCYDVQER